MSTTAPKTVERLAARRLRRSNALPELPSGEMPYAVERAELRDLSPGAVVRQIIGTAAFAATVGQRLEALDARRFSAHRSGRDPLYTSLELESVHLYRVLQGSTTMHEARNTLTSDEGAACKRALGFDQPRNHVWTKVHGTDGVPSEAMLSRHRSRFPDEERLPLYGALFDLLNIEHLTLFPEAVEDARAANADGSKVEITGTAPIRDPKTGEVVNAAKITVPDAGYVGGDAPADKRGHGYNFVAMFGARRVPLTRPHITRLDESEKTALQAVLDDFERAALPHLPNDHITILSTDGAFHSQTVRERAHGLRVVMNTHFASHKPEDPKTQKNVAERNRFRYRIDRYPNWRANGHREIACVCGKGTTSKKIELSKSGRLVVRTLGFCKKCGSITITAGKWKLAHNPDRFTPINPADPADKPDWAFGNPLTYNDVNAAELGNKRRGSENVHAVLTDRWPLLRGKRSFRNRTQVELEATVIFCAMHTLAMEYRRRTTVNSAPPLELAA